MASTSSRRDRDHLGKHGAWPATWSQCALTLAELSLVHTYQQPTTITEEP